MTISKTNILKGEGFETRQIIATSDDGLTILLSRAQSSTSTWWTVVHKYFPTCRRAGKTFYCMDEMMGHYKSCRGMLLAMNQQLNEL